MKKIYSTPVVYIVETYAEKGILAVSTDTTGPAAINDQYTDAEAFSNRRFDIWGENED